jgi:NADH:ubiquinone oxidoreductase subunit 3 (subunit A)
VKPVSTDSQDGYLDSAGPQKFLPKIAGAIPPWLGVNHPTPSRHEPGMIALRGLALPGLRLTMPCFLLFIVLLFPRVALVLMWIFSTYLQRAFHGGLVLPVLGFIFLPLTTLVYAWELNSGMPTAGINLLWLLIAVIIDLGGLGGGAHRQSRR